MAPPFADISHHQATVDFDAYTAAGHRWVVIKATGGATDGTLRYVDPLFAERWRQAAALGLRRVAYHFARNNNPGADEFAWCLDRINAAGGLSAGDILCYDQEDSRAQMTATAKQRTQEFLSAAVAAGVQIGWIYSGKWFLDPAGIRAADVPPGWRQLWISDYTAGQADTAIELPAGWDRGQLVARQFTDQAAVPGVSGGCDYSRWLQPEPEEDDMPTLDEYAAAAADATLAKLNTVGQADGFARRMMVFVRDQAGLATSAQIVNGVAQLVAGNSSVAAGIKDSRSAVLGALAAIPTDHMSDEERAELAADVAGQVSGLAAAEVEQALRHVFADAGQPDPPPQ